MKTITLDTIKAMNADTFSVQDNSPRGVKTVTAEEIKPGDRVVIDNHFCEVVAAPEQEQAEHGGETVIYSVEIEPTGYTDDLFNGTLDECIEYIKAHGYTGADDGARIAKIQLDEDGTISSTLDIITADHWEQEQTTADIIRKAANIIKARKDRSAWDRGVNAYALELLDNLAELTPDDLADPESVRGALLNGADNWQQYSEGGCALIYDCDIAERLCTPSELKRCRGGEWNLSSRENWLDVQARALRRAGYRVEAAIKEVRS